MVGRTRLNVTLYIHGLSFFSIGDTRLRLCGPVVANVPTVRLSDTRILRLVNERNRKITIVPGEEPVPMPLVPLRTPQELSWQRNR